MNVLVGLAVGVNVAVAVRVIDRMESAASVGSTGAGVGVLDGRGVSVVVRAGVNAGCTRGLGEGITSAVGVAPGMLV